MLVGELWTAVTFRNERSWEKMRALFLLHDSKAFSIDENLNYMKEKISPLTKVVWFKVVDVDHVMDLLMSDKVGLSNEDVIGVRKGSRKEAGRRVQKRLKLCVS